VTVTFDFPSSLCRITLLHLAGQIGAPDTGEIVDRADAVICIATMFNDYSSVDPRTDFRQKAFAVVPVRMSALRLSAAIRPSMPSFLRMVANSERRVATSLMAPSR
jgi:TPP-dependent 2-oxoacid decarboxylase